MRVGSLFSGIGGLDLGLERAGMEVAWQVEIDEWCRLVLAKHWPDVPRYRDIRETLARTKRILGAQPSSEDERRKSLYPASVDLICGGFPCQPVSLAGKRKGKEDERWLWPEFADTIRLLRPRYVLVENVPGLLTQGMGDVLGDLAALGYDAEWDCIPAAAVGAPHLRYRVFIVAYAQGTGLQARNADGLRDSTGRGIQDSASTRRGQLADTKNAKWRQVGSARDDWWTVEPTIRRVVNGVPNRVHRLRGLGNAVVPQVAEYIGRRIMELEH